MDFVVLITLGLGKISLLFQCSCRFFVDNKAPQMARIACFIISFLSPNKWTVSEI